MDGLGRGLSDMWRSVVLFLPTALAFIAVLVIGYVLARLVRTLVGKALHRVGFDKAVDRGTLGRTLRDSKISASDLCAKIAFYAVLLFALQLAFGLWGPNPVSDLLTALIAWLPRAFVAIVIIVVAAAIAGAVHDLIASALGGLEYGRLLARVASVLIIALGVIAALDQVRIATAVTQPLLIAVLATVAGILIVGVGGGLIRPMQHRWDGWLERAGTESAAIREQARAYNEEKARAAAEAEAARQAEEARLAEEKRLAEEARKAEEARLAEEKRLAEEARQAEEARLAEERRVAEEKRLEEERLAEEKRREDERLAAELQAEQDRVAAERRAEQERVAAEERRKAEETARAAEAARAEEVRLAEEARKAELTRIAEEKRQAGTADDTAVVVDPAADTAEQRVVPAESPAESPVESPVEAEATQVIPTQEPPRPRRVTDTAFDLEVVDDRPHIVPGFDRDETEPTQTLPPVGGADDTQVLPAEPPKPPTRRRRP